MLSTGVADVHREEMPSSLNGDYFGNRALCSSDLGFKAAVSTAGMIRRALCRENAKCIKTSSDFTADNSISAISEILRFTY
jgi:hypothetical protein